MRASGHRRLRRSWNPVLHHKAEYRLLVLSPVLISLAKKCFCTNIFRNSVQLHLKHSPRHLISPTTPFRAFLSEPPSAHCSLPLSELLLSFSCSLSFKPSMAFRQRLFYIQEGPLSSYLSDTLSPGFTSFSIYLSPAHQDA